jgi:hypothetical protein
MIFRGLKDRFDYGFIDPKKGRTIYTESTSYYSFLVDWFWKKFPSREKAVIGTPDKKIASNFGSNLYALIPYDDAHFGVCPDDDFWNAFPYLFKNLGISDMLEFDNVLGDLMGKKGLTRPKFFPLLKETAKKWDDKEKLKQGIEKAPKGFKYKDWMQYFYDSKQGFIETLKDLLDPQKNGFIQDRYRNLNPRIFRTDHELWTNSKCLLIHESKLNDFFNMDLQEQMLKDTQRREKSNKLIGERRLKNVENHFKDKPMDEYTKQRIQQTKQGLTDKYSDLQEGDYYKYK